MSINLRAYFSRCLLAAILFFGTTAISKASERCW